MRYILLSTALAAAVLANPVPQSAEDHAFMKRSCAPQASGAGPIPFPDTASAFVAYPEFAAFAGNATTPSGYVKTYTNLNASSNAYGYMGFTLLDSYDTVKCASQCDSIYGCAAFNLFFERDPSQSPDEPSCANPPSTTVIKCVFWGGPVTVDDANNHGSTYNEFEFAIAGSNGYINGTINPATGYDFPTYLGNSAISAPKNCQGSNTYMGFRTFTDGPFDAGKCADACDSQSQYNLAHPPSDGSEPMTYQSFNTYVSLLNGVSVGQYCVLYNETWPVAYATNTGYTSDDDIYTIAYSYSYSNSTDPGVTLC